MVQLSSKRHFLATVAVVGCIFFLVALHGPRPLHPQHHVGQQLEESLHHADSRALLQATPQPLHSADDDDGDIAAALVTPSPHPSISTETTHRPTTEAITTEEVVVTTSPEDELSEEEKEKAEERAETLAQLKRRGWQSQLEVERALDILRRTDELMSKVGRDYFLTDGSLLGYCRHEGGFTPWDDDMDIMTPRENMDWLLSDEGRQHIAEHGLELYELGKYHKLYLAGDDIPRAGSCSWGYPFLDVFPYDVNATTGLIEVHGSSPKEPSVYLPTRRVQFHPRIPRGLLVPSQPGLLLDMLFSGWRTTCKMEGWNHRLEDGDDSLEGDCVELTQMLGTKLAPPERCWSPSIKHL